MLSDQFTLKSIATGATLSGVHADARVLLPHSIASRSKLSLVLSLHEGQDAHRMDIPPTYCDFWCWRQAIAHLRDLRLQEFIAYPPRRHHWRIRVQLRVLAVCRGCPPVRARGHWWRDSPWRARRPSRRWGGYHVIVAEFSEVNRLLFLLRKDVHSVSEYVHPTSYFADYKSHSLGLNE